MHSIWCPLKTSEGKGQSFINCSPRPRGQGGRHGLEWPPSPQRVSSRGTRKKWWNNFCVQIGDMLMSFNCRWDLLDADENSFPLILPGFCESALRASGHGRLSRASAGRATATKLQIIESATIWMEPRVLWHADLIEEVKAIRFSSASCEPLPEAHGRFAWYNRIAAKFAAFVCCPSLA